MYWTLFLVITSGLSEASDKDFIPLFSSVTREECEASRTVADKIVVSHPAVTVEIKCLKTDEWKKQNSLLR